MHNPYLPKTQSNKNLESKWFWLPESIMNHFLCGSLANKLIFDMLTSVCKWRRRFIIVKIQKCGITLFFTDHDLCFTKMVF